VTDGVFNASLAGKLYKGFDEENDTIFQKGVCEFNDSFDYSDGENQLDELLRYLHFIGITIQKQSILNAV
jgi:hypothetical protein